MKGSMIFRLQVRVSVGKTFWQDFGIKMAILNTF